MKQTSLAPTNKMVMSGVAGALTILIVWAVKQWARVEIPTEVAQAITIVLSFLTGWLTPPGESDQIEPKEES